MGDKKVLVIPLASVFSRYVRARDGLLRMAIYDERLFPNDALQMRYYNILRLKKEWQLVGVYTDDSSSYKNKNDFRKLLKLCERRKIDMILCSSLEHLSEKTSLLAGMGVPIYVMEESRIIDNEFVRNIPMAKSQP